MKYRLEIDGLRAFAVLPVILFHGRVPGFPGGYVGVDIFFVISGYLITTIIASEISHGQFSIVNFYERRARRILPALFLVMIVTTPFAIGWMMPSQLQDYFQSIVAVNLFSSNGLFWIEDGYFNLASEDKPLLHTWSLAVEEQFYIFFPLLLMFLMRRKRDMPIGVLAGLGLISFGICLWASRHWPSAAFYLTPFRAWELLVGSICALYLLKHNKSSNGPLAVIGMLLILLSVFTLDAETPFPSEYTVLPVLGTAFIILFADSSGRIGQLLSIRPIVGIGLLSYSAYLWHQPIIALARIRLNGAPDLPLTFGLIALTFALAYFSWRFVETPVRKAKASEGQFATILAKRSVIFGFSALAIASLSGFSLYGVSQKGFASSFDKVNVADYRWDNRVLQRESATNLRALGSKHRGPYGDPLDQTLWYTDPKKRNLLLVGNSHSRDLYNILLATDTVGAQFEVARYGVNFSTLNDPHPIYEAPNYKQADYIIVATRIYDRDIEILPQLIKRFQKDGKGVIIFANSPEFSGGQVVTLADEIILPELMYKTGRDFSDIANQVNHHYWQDLKNPRQQKIEALNAQLDTTAEEFNIPIISRMAYTCDDIRQSCDMVGNTLAKHYYDRNHTTLDGAHFFAKKIDQLNLFENAFDP